MDPWTDRLSDYIDGELAPAERGALEQHLVSCADCRAAVAGLRRVVERAATLAPRSPATDLWPGVEQRIRTIRPRGRTIAFSLPQLAAAALVLMTLSGGLAWMLREGRTTPASAPAAGARIAGDRAPATTLPVSFADDTYDRAVKDLQQALEVGRQRLDPETVKVIENNLAAVDAAIAQAQRALDSDPSNTYLNVHLVDARRRKLALLRRASALADPEG